MKKYCLKMICLFGSMLLCALVFADAPGYHVINKIKLGGEGGWDCLTVDSTARRLYVSRGTHVAVVDIDANKLVGDIPNTQGVHGIALAPEFNRGFISCGKANMVMIFDLKTLQVVSQAKVWDNPDVIIYDQASKKVFSFNGRSKDTAVIDAASGVLIKTIPLGGKPEFAAADGKGKIYVNLEDTSEVAVIDSKELVLMNRYSLKPGEEPSGIGLDAERHIVFSGCHNNLMTVLDADAGKVIATVPIGSGVDGSGFDPATGLAFSSNGEGTLTVVQMSSGTYTVAETVPTQKGARTMALDTATHNIYLPTAQFGPAPLPTKANPKPRPVPVKGTFVILVVGK
jgi:DNA-binding beta-propeller fold protein YncE